MHSPNLNFVLLVVVKNQDIVVQSEQFSSYFGVAILPVIVTEGLPLKSWLEFA